MAVLAASVARGEANAGIPGLPATDARGFSRLGAPVDLGAYQNQYTVTTVTPVTTLYNPTGRTTITVAAGVSNRGAPVPEGQITFVVAGQTVTANVNAQGVAAATITLPARFGPGNIPIAAMYHDPSGIFSDSPGSAPLIVSAGNTATTITSVTNQYPFLSFSQLETVTATVVDQFGLPINEGVILFQVNGLSIAAPVHNGTASAVFDTPLLNMAFLTYLLNPHALTATYIDSAGVFGNSASATQVPAILFDFINQFIFDFLQMTNQQSVTLGLSR
jgi:hypothetical protein